MATNNALNLDNIGGYGNSITLVIHEGLSSYREGFIRIKEFRVDGNLTPHACEEVARLFWAAAEMAKKPEAKS